MGKSVIQYNEGHGKIHDALTKGCDDGERVLESFCGERLCLPMSFNCWRNILWSDSIANVRS